MRFWKNPEFVRHLRAELRTTRAVTVLGVVLVICVLIGLGCWGSYETQIQAYRSGNHLFGKPTTEQLAQLEAQSSVDEWFAFYRFLIYAQMAVLTFWSLLCCAQSISGERERKTWDFQRATRLSPGEFLIGKLLGEPVVAYFIVLCCLPITLLAGLLGHAGTGNILSAYLLVFSGALFLGLVGLWVSNLFETRSRGIGLIGTFGLYILFAFAITFVGSSFPGSAAFSPLTGLIVRLQADHPEQVATIFGKVVSWVVMSLLLYSTFGAWLVLMILRGLKKDFDQIKPLSRWQAVGCAAFLNFSAYALFQPNLALLRWMQSKGNANVMTADFATTMVIVNSIVLFAMGLALISPHDRLKIWWRSRTGLRSLIADDGPPWPWLVISGIVGYALLVWGMFAWKNDVGFDRNTLMVALIQSLTVLVFVTRDILFLQWCRLTRMRAPLLKGMLYLGLYYIAATVLSLVFGISSTVRGRDGLALLTPAGAFDNGTSFYSTMVFAGFSIQVALIILLLMATAARLRQGASVFDSSAAR